MSTAVTDDPTSLSARVAAAAIREGTLSSRDLVNACLSRVNSRDPSIKAWHFLDPSLPRKEAEARDGAPQAARGVLHGVPVGVKDIVDTVDMPTACNCPIYRDKPARGDASCVTALRQAGGIVLGKTATTEFAAFTPTQTRNPHNPGHTPGGSSSGSAAAVADFQVPLAIGTQTAGSIIRPAAFCGVVGFKPTFGTIDRTGVKPFADALDTVGVFARTVDDAALFAGAMAGWPEMRRGRAPVAPKRVLIVRAPAWERISEESEQAVNAAGRIFEAAGVPVEEAMMPDGFDALNEVHDILHVYEGHRALAYERAQHGESLSQGLRSHFERAEAKSFNTYLAARQTQEAWFQRFDAELEAGEVVLTASAAGEAPEGLEFTGDPAFARTWTLLHLPCITLPQGRGPKNLPLGVQLVGPRWDDLSLLGAARWLAEKLA